METKHRHLFECKECGHTKYVCVRPKADVKFTVTGIDKGVVQLEPFPKIDDGIETRFECAKCGSFIADNEDDLLLMLQQDYYVETMTFVEGITRLFPTIDDLELGETVQKQLISFLKNKGIEIEENK